METIAHRKDASTYTGLVALTAEQRKKFIPLCPDF